MTAPFTAPLFDYEARVISLLGKIDSPHIDLLIDQLLRLDTESPKEITLYISCQSGTLIDALKVIDVMKTLRSQVTAIGMGLIQGVGVPIFAAAPKRFLFPNALLTTMGLWSISGLEIQPTTGFGSTAAHPRDALVKELEGQVEYLRPTILARLIREAATMPRLFTAQEAISLGLADDLVPTPKQILPPRSRSHVR